MRTISPVKKNKNFVVEEANTYVYKLTKFEKDGWALAHKYKPIPYAMVTVLTDKGKEKNGWWADFFWDGYRISSTDKIIKWKRFYYGKNCWGYQE